jgi:hypothetical protein
MDLVRRAKAAQATLDRFRGQPFAWGKNDCARMALFHLRKLGKRIKGPPAGSYSNPAEAKRELKKLGHKTLGAFLDAHFERVPHAAAIIGDIMELPGAEGLSGLAVCLGNGRVVGYHETTEGAEVLQPLMISGAWRVS